MTIRRDEEMIEWKGLWERNRYIKISVNKKRERDGEEFRDKHNRENKSEWRSVETKKCENERGWEMKRLKQ
jgi:DeoR/GlpR family transcriptional regulator of sugar metabolism